MYFLEKEKAKGTFFKKLISKEDDIYVPLLKAFMQEVRTQVENGVNIPRKLVEYLLSKYDFYKVISLDNKKNYHNTIIQYVWYFEPAK